MVDSLSVCNPWPLQARVIPGVLIVLLALAIWRYRAPTKPEGSRAIAHTLFKAALIKVILTIGVVSAVAWVFRRYEASASWPGPLEGLIWCILLMLCWGYWAYDFYRRHEVETRSLRPANLAPALCGILVASILILGLWSGSFLESPQNSKLKELYLAVSQQAPDAVGQDFAGRAQRGITMALTIIIAIVAAWVVAGLWWGSSSSSYSRKVTGWVVLLAVIFSSMLWTAAALSAHGGLDSAYGNAMLCANWSRADTPWMAMVSDANNIWGIFIPAVVAFGMCLVLEPVGAQKDARYLARIGEKSRLLDDLLYVGATSLVFGILQTSAVHVAALSPLPSTSSVKQKADLCKAVALPPGQSASSAQITAQWFRLGCERLGDEAAKAEVADSARQFVKSVTILFGVCFSVILAAMYAPAVLLLKKAAEEFVGEDEGSTRSKILRKKQLQQLGIDSDLLGKAGKVITTLTPLVAGVLASIFGAFG